MKFLVGCLALILGGFTAAAQSAASPSATPPAAPVVLHVAVRNIDPFCMEEDGKRTGFAIDLWEMIAKETGLQFDTQTVPNAQAMVDALAAKKVDVGLGALSVTAQREQIIDFSHPFYDSGLDILTTSKGASPLKLLAVLFNPALLKMLGLLLAAVFVISHLLWLFEKKVNDEEFPGSYGSGISESLWYTICVMITLGCENKSPRGWVGRSIGIVWMLSGVVLVSIMTASFSSSLTVNSLNGAINGPGDLPGHKVATITGSTAERWLKARKVTIVGVADVAAVCKAVEDGSAEAAVYDAPLLRYQLTKVPSTEMHLTGALFEKQGYAIGLQNDSPYRERINEALLKLIENHALQELDKKWFGEPSEKSDK